MESFLDSNLFAFLVLPLLIFVARIMDVSMQTLRIIFISKNFKLIAATIGFFEVLIWLTAITQIMKNLHNPLCYVAYALGFSTGTFLGIKLENKLSLGRIVVRLILNQECQALIEAMKEEGFGMTIVDAYGTKGKLHLLYSIMERSKLSDLVALLQQHAPKAFYTVEDIRHSQGGYFPIPGGPGGKTRNGLRWLFFQKK
jgi:uncharacterized protein YebE (UPF0316 family)